jgi:uncharacterized membrane protein (GlpM family)
MGELIVRFLLGGLVVSLFAAVSDALRPRTYAGLFGAAPSVALASLFLTYRSQGAEYVALEGRSMIAGAAALFVYTAASSRMIRRASVSPWVSTTGLWSVWLIVALALWFLWLRG